MPSKVFSPLDARGKMLAALGGGLTAVNPQAIRGSRSWVVPAAPEPSEYLSVRTRNARRMPSRTLTRRTRRGKKRRFGRRRRRGIPPMWPRFKLVKFRVVTKFSLSPIAGALGTYTVQANALEDPHGGLGANLPLGLDQLAAMYNKYVVVGSKHYVRVHNVSSTGAVIYGFTLRNPAESSALASAEAYLEAPRTVSKMLSPDVDHSGLGISYSAKRYWRVRKFMDHENLHGTFSTTPGLPTNRVYVDFWYQDVNTTDNATIEGFLTSEYVCLLFDPKTPARSAV